MVQASSFSLHQLSSQHVQGHGRRKTANAFAISQEISLDYFGPAAVCHGMKYQANGLLNGTAAGAGHAGDADSKSGFAAIADAFGQSRRHFTADRSMPLDHLGRDAGKLRLELIRIHDGAAQKIPRAAADRGNALRE